MTNALLIAAPHSGAGKTLVSLGLMRALAGAGVAVAAAKSGPDYIDPQFHQAALGRPSVNLDAWAMTPGALRARAAGQGGDILLVEGAMGLLDGAPEGPSGRGGAADLAAALGAPVVMVIDAARMSHSAALPLAGAAALRPDIAVAGAILNRVAGDRHARIAAAAVEAAGFRVFGALPRLSALATPSRHLGLVQARERPDLEAFVAGAAAAMRDHLDLEALVAAARPLAPAGGPAPALPPLGQTIAVAHDDAFAFAYPHLLADWRAAGAGVALFSPLADEGPAADADAVFLPGGYPELHAGRLAAAANWRAGLSAAAARGARIYGECGGFMALGEALIDADGLAHRMAGLLPLTTSFAARRLHLGYRRLFPAPGAPFAGPLAAHEFHYATIAGEGAAARLFAAEDAEGAALGEIGLRRGGVCGSFAHLIGPAPA